MPDAVGLDLLIVGAGFGGLCMLHRARAAGLSVRAVEAAPSVGGTWFHNRYPGARVDIESHEYSFSFDESLQQEWRWSERYAGQPELLRYANHVADRFALRPLIDLNTRVVGAAWHEPSRRWRVRAHDGRQWHARFLVMASGPLSTPNTPRLDGLDAFAGRTLHTADWPHEPVDFRDLRVGVVGTGSSGVQVIPRIASQAPAKLTVFQRTAAYVVPAHNGPLDAALEARVRADYAGFRTRQRRMPGGLATEHPPYRVSALAVDDAERSARFEERWRIGGFPLLTTFYDILLDARANALAAEFVRRKIRAAVPDAATAELLCPGQPIGCKRLCIDSSETGYYATFNSPHVELVDVARAPIEHATPRGLVVGGREHALDMLVFATGFDAITGSLTRLDLHGADGLTMRDKWAAGPLNYLGLGTAGFPNLFHVAGAGSTAAFTAVTLAIEHHVDWIAACMGWLRAHGRTRIEARADAERDWMAHLNEMAARTVFLSCDSWYLGANIPGKPRVFAALTSGFPPYVERCAQVAADGYAGFDIA
jgi:cation diffusion facilitator CzcD-associated flavoprotein CzcO